MDAEKRAPIKLRPVQRKNAGRITEPYQILERLLDECDEFEPIREAKIRMYWRKDWQADVDGVVVGAQCAKATDRERLLAEESGERVDLIILLPEQTWDTLDGAEKEHRLYHELCHFAPALDSNGEQKFDEKDRPLWRLKRHPIVAFPSEVKRYGADSVLHRNERLAEALEAAETPLFNLDGDGEAGWRELGLGVLGLTASQQKAFEKDGAKTLGQVSEKMNRDRWWLGVPGISEKGAAKVAELFADFWADNPQYAEAG